jgi:CRP-like cAMP-binding protein
MSGRDSFQLYPETRFAHRDGKRAVFTHHSPRQNQLLAALPLEDYERLLPGLEPVSLPLGLIIHGAGDREKYLYFLTAGIVAKYYVTESGASAEFAVTGNEGVIGIASFLGGESMPNQAMVLSPGYAYRLEAGLVKDEFEHDGPLVHLLLRYTQALITQMVQTAACNRHHALDQQLCRWLLLTLDRLPHNEVSMTQEVIGNMLGVRRESVTEAAGKLQAEGLINYSRGKIVVLNRPKLESRACECYAVVKHESDRLLAGKTAFAAERQL